MRCPDCNKFVPYDTEMDPEENGSPDVTDTTFSATYTRKLSCEECGTELKKADVELDKDFSDYIEGGKENCEHDWEIDTCDAEPTTGAVTTDRHGRPIRNSRYMTTLYGVSCHVELTCSKCNATASFDVEDSVEASSMDELGGHMKRVRVTVELSESFIRLLQANCHMSRFIGRDQKDVLDPSGVLAAVVLTEARGALPEQVHAVTPLMWRNDIEAVHELRQVIILPGAPAAVKEG